MCELSRVPFGRNVRFSLEVSQKFFWSEPKRGRRFFWRSNAAWESSFAKVALKALGRCHFHFGGEWVVFSRILVFLLLFGGRPNVFVVFGRVL